jgi:hypothetical protein
MIINKNSSIIPVFAVLGLALVVSACGGNKGATPEKAKPSDLTVNSVKFDTPVADAFEYPYTTKTELTDEQRDQVIAELLSLHNELRSRPGFPEFSGVFYMRPHVVTADLFLASAKRAKSNELLEMLFAFRVLKDTGADSLNADLKSIEIRAPEFYVHKVTGEFMLELGLFEQEVTEWRAELKSLENELRHFLKFGISYSENLRREALKDIVQKVEAQLPAIVTLEIPYEHSRYRSMDLDATRATLEKLAQFNFGNLNKDIRSIYVNEDYLSLTVGAGDVHVVGDKGFENSALSAEEIHFFLTELISRAEYEAREKLMALEEQFRARKDYSKIKVNSMDGFEHRTELLVYEVLLQFPENYFKKGLTLVNVKTFISGSRYDGSHLEFRHGITREEMIEFLKNLKQE